MDGNRVQVERETGTTTDNLGTQIPAWTIVYMGESLIEYPQQTSSLSDSAGRPVVVNDHVGRFPIGTDITTGDRVTVLASNDPKMVGQTFRVVFDETQDLAVDRQVRLVRSVYPVRSV